MVSPHAYLPISTSQKRSLFNIHNLVYHTERNTKEVVVPMHSIIPIRITRLPHLTRETGRRHDRVFILHLRLLHPTASIPRRALRWNTTALDLELARLALFLRRQRSPGSDCALAGVIADVGLERRERLALWGRDGTRGGLRGGWRVVSVLIGSWGGKTGGIARTRATPLVFGRWGWRRGRRGTHRLLERASTDRRGVGWWRGCGRFRRRGRQCRV